MIVHNSGPSFYVNHLLGFTAIDRINCPITLYPERFLSASRIKAGSLADIDFNCGNTSVFEESQREILGDGHSYPMIAYGTLKPKAAWLLSSECTASTVSKVTLRWLGIAQQYDVSLLMGAGLLSNATWKRVVTRRNLSSGSKNFISLKIFNIFLYVLGFRLSKSLISVFPEISPLDLESGSEFPVDKLSSF